MNTHRHHEQGYSLVEMLVVLAILVITMVAIFPMSQKSTEVQRLESATRSLAALIQRTRSTAMTSNKSQSLIYDRARRLWHSNAMASAIELPANFAIDLKTAASAETNEIVTFQFFPDGGSSGGQITLSTAGTSRSIEINWLTGSVSLATAESAP